MKRERLPKSIASIGHICKRGDHFEVHCAACGAGKRSPSGTAEFGKREAARRLRTIGWSDALDKRWRCKRCHEYSLSKGCGPRKGGA